MKVLNIKYELELDKKVLVSAIMAFPKGEYSIFDTRGDTEDDCIWLSFTDGNSYEYVEATDAWVRCN